MRLLQLLFCYALQKTQQSGPKHKSKYDSSMISMFSRHVTGTNTSEFQFRHCRFSLISVSLSL